MRGKEVPARYSDLVFVYSFVGGLRMMWISRGFIPLLLISAAAFFAQVSANSSETKDTTKESTKQNRVMTIYDFELEDISGKPVKLKDYQGKVLMIVNVADRSRGTRDRGLGHWTFPLSKN